MVFDHTSKWPVNNPNTTVNMHDRDDQFPGNNLKWHLNPAYMDGLWAYSFKRRRPGRENVLEHVIATKKIMGTYLHCQGIALVLDCQILSVKLNRQCKIKGCNYNRLGAQDDNNTRGRRCFYRANRQKFQAMLQFIDRDYFNEGLGCDPILTFPGLFEGQSQIVFNAVYKTPVSGKHQQYTATNMANPGPFVLCYHFMDL